MIETLVDIILLAFLAITAIAINRIRNLFAVIMLFGIFSLFSAGVFVVMDAADVAFTEAAIGAGIGMLHQDPLVALPFSALENFVLGRTGRIDMEGARRRLTEGASRK